MERTEPPHQGGELATLTAYLDYQRATAAGRLAGLTAEQAARTLPPSPLTIVGLVKHLALVEDDWFQRDLLGRRMPPVWDAADFAADRDWEFHSAVDDGPEAVLALYDEACARSRAAVAEVGDDPGALSKRTLRHTGEPFSVRWLLCHMIEETARHNGHADLIRESIDGVTGE
jgi:uncharacterized damage-inducible protein DinB